MYKLKDQIINNFFYKDKTNEEFIEFVNKQYPISISHLEDMIERVHNKYPIISKSDIAIITKTFFEVFREYLFFGYVFNIRNLFSIYLSYDKKENCVLTNKDSLFLKINHKISNSLKLDIRDQND